MKQVGIIGAGTMGAGIAQAFLSCSYDVKISDATPALAEAGRARIAAAIEKLAAKGKLSPEQAKEMLSRLTVGEGPAAFAGFPLVIEATLEQMELKKALFAGLSKAAGPACILASNTSSLSITELASAAERPERVVGMHFFNPAPVMKLVEIVQGARTGEDAVKEAVAIAEGLGKTPVVVQDSPGFIVNRALVPMINEAAAMYAEGVADAQSIDIALKLGCNHPIGPLALADMIGLDIILHVMETLQREFGEDKYRVHPMIRKMVRAGTLGVKTKKGFYEY